MDSYILQLQARQIDKLTKDCQQLVDNNFDLEERVRKLMDEKEETKKEIDRLVYERCLYKEKYEQLKAKTNVAYGESKKQMYHVFQSGVSIIVVKTSDLNLQTRTEVESYLQRYGYKSHLDLFGCYATDEKDAVKQYLTAYPD